MQADSDRKVSFDPNQHRRRSLSEFLVDLIIGVFRIFAIPFRWLNDQMKLVMDDKKKKDNFVKWYSKQRRRASRRLRLNNEF